MGLNARKPVSGVCEQQWRRPCRLISAFVIRFLQSIIPKLPTGEISIFKLVSIAEETCLSLALAETVKTGFVVLRPK